MVGRHIAAAKAWFDLHLVYGNEAAELGVVGFLPEVAAPIRATMVSAAVPAFTWVIRHMLARRQLAQMAL